MTARRAKTTAAALAIGLASAAPHEALAAKQHFEPTDLELENPGWLDVDLQYGLVQGADALRFVAPDLELDLGLTSRVEIDFDCAYGVEHPSLGSRSRQRAVLDDGWLSAKLGLWSARDERARTSWGLGVQIGPKLPLAPDAHGIGYEGLAMLARTWGGTHLVLEAGGLVDPGAAITSKRPIGAELGADFAQDLDRDGTWSIISDVGAIIYATPDPYELQATAGIQWEPFETLDLSLVALVGAPPGSDRYGALLGVSPKFKLW